MVEKEKAQQNTEQSLEKQIASENTVGKVSVNHKVNLKDLKSSPKRQEIINNSLKNSVTYLGDGYSIKDPRMKLLPIGVGLPDADRKGHFWCFGTTRVGKELSVDTLIHTPDGWKRNGDIKVGDFVTAPDGSSVKVTGVYPQGIKPLYKVEFSGGRSIESGLEHLWEIYVKQDKKEKPEKKIANTQEIIDIINSGKKVYIPVADKIEKPKKDLVIHPYIMGCLIADGNLKRISLLTRKSYVVNRVYGFLPDDAIFTEYFAEESNRVYHNIKFEPYEKYLKDCGLFDLPFEKRFIPKEYIESNIEDRIELLRGIFDAVGVLSKTNKKRSIHVVVKSEQLAKDISELIWSLGGLVKVKAADVENADYKRYILFVTYSKVYNKLSTLPSLQSHLNNKIFNEPALLRLKSIEYSRDGYAQCISVDREDGLYVAEHYIVTHNTRLMEEMIVQDILKGNSVVVIDPKGDIELLRNIIITAFISGRHKDLVFISPVYPEYSAFIDPLSYYYMPEELVGHIVSGVETGKEPFFYNVAYEISLMVVLSLLAKAKQSNQEKPHFSLLDVKNIISHQDLSKLKLQIDEFRMFDPGLQQLSDDLAKILESPQDYYSKVSSSLRVALTELTSGNIGKIIGSTDTNRFLKKLEGDDPMCRMVDGKPVKSVIFVAQLGSLMTRKAAFTLGKIIISMIQSFTGRVFSSGQTVDPPLALYIDEAQSVLYYGIEDLFAKAGGANVWIHGFSQSVNQMYAALGKDTAKSILDNTNTKIFMRVPDVDTAQYASQHFGTKKVISPILSSGGGISTREEETDTVEYDKFLNLAPRLFYMLTYKGVFKGKTFDTFDVVSPFVKKFNIKFPEIKGTRKNNV